MTKDLIFQVRLFHYHSDINIQKKSIIIKTKKDIESKSIFGKKKQDYQNWRIIVLKKRLYFWNNILLQKPKIVFTDTKTINIKNQFIHNKSVLEFVLSAGWKDQEATTPTTENSMETY